MSIYTPYFYIIGWRELDRWYVGCRYRKGCHPSDLMTTYFTSSKNYVHPFIEQHGLPDVVWTFPCKTAEEARAGEFRIMCEFAHFLSDDRWLNRAKGTKIVRDIRDKDKWRAKLREANIGKTIPLEVRQRMSATRTGRSSSLKGKSLSEGHKQSVSEALKGRTISEETRKKLSEAAKRRYADPAERAKTGASNKGKTAGRKQSEETKRAKSERLKGKPWSAARRAAEDRKRAAA